MIKPDFHKCSVFKKYDREGVQIYLMNQILM